MKSIIFNNNLGLLIFRIGISLLMFFGHGFPKLQKLLSGSEIQFADPIGVGIVPSFYLVVFAEALCSISILIGFQTRIASFFLFFTMVVATFVMLGKGEFPELSLLYLAGYILLMIVGGGNYSIDNLLRSKNKL